VAPAKIKEQDETPRLGIALAEVGVVVYPWYVAIGKGFAAAWFGLVNIFVTFYLLIKNLILGQGLSFQVAGPVGIASVVGQSARLGVNYLINITAMISLSLAAMNILPIPALDGGRAFFVILEKILGKKVPAQYEQLAHAIGFVLLMILVLVVTGRDIIRLIR
jgi:regulator of sigma E protease